MNKLVSTSLKNNKWICSYPQQLFTCFHSFGGFFSKIGWGMRAFMLALKWMHYIHVVKSHVKKIYTQLKWNRLTTVTKTVNAIMMYRQRLTQNPTVRTYRLQTVPCRWKRLGARRPCPNSCGSLEGN